MLWFTFSSEYATVTLYFMFRWLKNYVIVINLCHLCVSKILGDTIWRELFGWFIDQAVGLLQKLFTTNYFDTVNRFALKFWNTW